MTRHAQRDPAQQSRADGREQQADQQRQPGRHTGSRRQIRRGIGANAGEGRLTKRGHTADAGQEYHTNRHQGRHADVIGLNNPKWWYWQQRQCQKQQHKSARQDRVGSAFEFHHHASSSSCTGAEKERHNNTGSKDRNTITSLKSLAQKEL